MKCVGHLSLGDHCPLYVNNIMPSYPVCSDQRRTAMPKDGVYSTVVGGERTERLASQFEGGDRG